MTPLACRGLFGPVVLAVVLLTGGLTLVRPSPASAAQGLPPSSTAVDEAFVRSVFDRHRDFYLFGILPDGFPGRWIGGSLIAHPIYGTYVLRAYVDRYQAEPSPGLLAGMRAFANVAIARMTPVGDALVMNNPPALGFIRSPGLRYSGLTMGYFAYRLAQIGQLTGDAAISAAAEKCFRSLLIPETDGGVLYRWGDDVALAEAPGDPADLTLNGWLSILSSLHGYFEATGTTEAKTLFNESVVTLARLLPLYDVPALHLSRYALSGPTKARLVLSDRTSVRLSDARVVIPDSGSYPLAIGGAKPWANAVASRDVKVTTNAAGVRRLLPRGRAIGLNLVLTRLTYPTPNEVSLIVETSRAVSVSLELWSGRFDPRSSSQGGQVWQRAATVRVPAGRHAVSLAVPWALADGFAPLTNWAHVIDGRRVNIYHAIHVRRLEELYGITRIPALAEYAAIWRADMCAWATVPAYAGLYVTDDDGSIVSPGALCPNPAESPRLRPAWTRPS